MSETASAQKTRREELREQCEAFDRAHPEVWQAFCRFTLERIRAGFRHGGVNAIFERMRWELSTPDDHGASRFKINNNYAPFYARWFAECYPEHAGFFRMRAQTSDHEPATYLPELTPADFPYTNQAREQRL